MSPNTILLIDDHALFRRGVAQLIEMDPAFTVVGEASSGPEGVEMAMRLTPDVILVDLNMPQVSGIETLELMRKAGVRSHVIMLTVSDSERDVVAALRAGAQGYLLKDMNPEDLCPSLKKALAGKPVLSEAVTGSLVHAVSAGQPIPAAQTDLTARELEVLDYLVAGLCNKAIARKLDISVGTVKVHVKHMLHKLNLHSRLEAVVWRHEHGTRDR
ncbi:Nitrate/nitrite response regulator protein [Caballeronia glathei]|jgi:two-component system nitrate/nitrite response regulator NarL|uniref:Transcriptional regulator NarL n=1 Tax=Caballeronia glathei TaxID=60547 RepID=A0A069PPB5_9BURK|nr:MULTISPECIES: two-component system response regulator NarL [Burkholderiaceae]KDR42485.1 transcriptional regulator NarL [Caballeronia glathei]TCK35426.1 LuxR family two component transcriptional regulator [Paraburkholderia sp. BL8N3]CDY78587.1 Nitrate/nitrite response regulator protein [Caballeronia glathei]